MKNALIILFIFSLNAFKCHGQGQNDTTQIYWENGLLKYQSICCLTDTIFPENTDEPVVILTRKLEIWDREGEEYLGDIESFIKKYGDIIEIGASPSKGKDEKEYRALILKADSYFDRIGLNSEDEIMNEAIKTYVKAKNMIPEASYPQKKLEDIHKGIEKK